VTSSCLHLSISRLASPISPALARRSLGRSVPLSTTASSRCGDDLRQDIPLHLQCARHQPNERNCRLPAKGTRRENERLGMRNRHWKRDAKRGKGMYVDVPPTADLSRLLNHDHSTLANASTPLPISKHPRKPSRSRGLGLIWRSTVVSANSACGVGRQTSAAPR
jgi:hypothetical protein